MTPAEMFDAIAAVSPSFDSVLKEHRTDNDEQLPHVLMGDLVRHLGAHFNACTISAPSDHEEVHTVLAILDAAMASGSRETENVIAASFIENIETETFFTQLKPFFGIALRRELTRQRESVRAR